MRMHSSRCHYENPDAPPWSPYRGVNPERGCRFLLTCATLGFVAIVALVLYLVLR